MGDTCKNFNKCDCILFDCEVQPTKINKDGSCGTVIGVDCDCFEEIDLDEE
jgi:hypothetical protein